MPVRFEAELFEAARARAEVSSRSAAQQLAHWARIGKAFESSPGVDQQAITAVLGGAKSYDDLNRREQAVVRAEWERRVADRALSLNLTSDLEAAGKLWVEADANGHPILHYPAGARE